MLTNTRLFKIFAKDSLNRAMFIMGIGAIVGVFIFIWQLLPFVSHAEISGTIAPTSFKDQLVVYEGALVICINLILGVRTFVSAAKSWNKSKYILLPARVEQLVIWNLIARFVVGVFAMLITSIAFLGLEWFLNSSYHDAIVEVLTTIPLSQIGIAFDATIALYLFVNLAVVTNNWLMGFVSDKWQQRVKVLGLITMIFVMGYAVSWIPDNWLSDIIVDIVMLVLIWYLLRYHNEAK